MNTVQTPWVKVLSAPSTDTSQHSLRIQVSADGQSGCLCCGEARYLVCSGDTQAMLAGEEQVELRSESDFHSLHATLLRTWHAKEVPQFPRLHRRRKIRAQSLQMYLLQVLAAAARKVDETAEMDPVLADFLGIKQARSLRPQAHGLNGTTRPAPSLEQPARRHEALLAEMAEIAPPALVEDDRSSLLAHRGDGEATPPDADESIEMEGASLDLRDALLEPSEPLTSTTRAAAAEDEPREEEAQHARESLESRRTSAYAAGVAELRAQAVAKATELNAAFRYEEARQVLMPYLTSKDVKARVQLAVCCMHLAILALDEKQNDKARDLSVEAVGHAEAAKAADSTNAQAHVWYGQTIQTKAKAVDGALEQAKVVATSVNSWEHAAALDPTDPLPHHLLGSFIFITCGLNWVAARALRGLSPGLKKYSFDDALTHLLESERLQPSPPFQYSVSNQSIIGRIYAQQGNKEQAKKWLSKAVSDEVPFERLDPTAKEARQAAEKALASL